MLLRRKKTLSLTSALVLLLASLQIIVDVAPAHAAAPSPGWAISHARNRKAQVALYYAWGQLGKPYRNDAGRFGPNHFDCSGLVWAAYAQALVNLGPPNLGYGDRWTGSIVKDPKLREIPLSQMLPGDLVFYITRDAYPLGHVGIYVGNLHMINATSRWGRVVLEPIGAPLSSPHVIDIWPKAYAIR